MIGFSMTTVERLHSIVVTLFLFLFVGCGNKETQQQDHPRLSPKVTMTDVTFRSSALGREMPYRIVMPSSISPGQKLPVVYLHGGGGGYHDWTNYSDVAKFAESGLILVMPEGNSSYYTNSVEHPDDRFEDYIVNDVISEVEGKYPAAAGRQNRAIVGVSMGGYGAVKNAMKHPELFAFAGGLSAAVDVPTRPFSIKRVSQWRFHSSIFGPSGSQARHDNDPYVLARSVDPGRMPYLFLTCGEQEGLLPANRKLAGILEGRGFKYEFHIAPGDHNWLQWDAQLANVFKSLQERIGPAK
jgi:putative tributyrin esterase